MTDAAMVLVSRGYEITGTAPGGRPGKKWKAKYAMVGASLAQQLSFIDGMNEKGLSVGALFQPGFISNQNELDPGFRRGDVSRNCR